MPFRIEPLRPLKRRRANSDDDVECFFLPKKHQRLDLDTSDSDSTSTMDIDDINPSTSITHQTTTLQKCYYGPGLLALPPSLDIFSVENTNWYWNATSWLANRQLDPVECNQICSQFQSHYGWSPSTGFLPALQLGTSEDMLARRTPKFSTFIVFPTASGDIIRSEGFLRAWTDYVMVPSISHAARKREGFSYGVPAYAKSYRAIKMASDCQRIVNSNLPDTPVSVKVRWDEVGELWQNMQRIVRNEPLMWEFQDMFLVVVAGSDSETGMNCFGSDLRSFWSHFSKGFDRAVNMDCVPAECVTISPKVYYGP